MNDIVNIFMVITRLPPGDTLMNSLHDSVYQGHQLHLTSSLWNLDYGTTRRINLNIFVFYDITPCSPVNVNQCFGGIYSLHLQYRRGIRGRNQTVWHYISEDTVFRTTVVRTSYPTGINLLRKFIITL
jgi:hypothetical protein